MSDDLEQRLRDSLRAYADLVDSPDDDGLPAPRPMPRPAVRRWRGAILVAAAAAAVVTGSLVVLDVRDPGSRSAAGSATGSALSRTDAPSAAAPESESATASGQALSGVDASAADGVGLPPSPQPGVAYAVDLYTHCGVRGVDIGGVWFAADPPLVVAGGNPPAGWGNPAQRGTLTLLTGTEAVFRDDAGHEVRLLADEPGRPAPCD